MVHDYWMHRDDRTFIETRLMGIQTVVDWFEQRLDAQTGMLGALPYWSFVDWPDQWPWTTTSSWAGNPTVRPTEAPPSSPCNWQVHWITRGAVRCVRQETGRRPLPRAGPEPEARPSGIVGTNRDICCRYPGAKAFSQHAMCWRCCRAACRGQARALVVRLNTEPGLTQCTQYFDFICCGP